MILAVDQGTSSSRAILFTEEGHPHRLAQTPFTQICPKIGWVEHDPIEIWKTQRAVIDEVLSAGKTSPAEIKAIGITNQRETTVVWDRNTGEPIYNAIVWQDRRTSEYCETLRQGGHAAFIQEITGLVVDPYFSATKLKWILDSIPGVRARAEKGEIAFGTIDSWLIWNMTRGGAHVTDVSNASRTMLFNIKDEKWDDDLLKLFGIPHAVLPKVVESQGIVGEFLGIPIAGIAGDQQAALFGQACYEPGMMKTTYGTGCFLLMNTGESIQRSKHNLLSTVAWKREGKIQYALEGSVFMGGALVKWIRDVFKIIEQSSQIEALARTVPDNGGVYFVPAHVGLGAPYWEAQATAQISGMTLSTAPGHIARATLEGIAFQVMDVVDAMRADSGIVLKELRVDGGASVDNLLMQTQADLLGVPVVRTAVPESTALGAAFLAGLAVGFWRDTETIAQQWKVDKRFEPKLSARERTDLIAGWRKAVASVRRSVF